ncbi:Rossmann fold nucleotide-binding protein Smf possibly involved in DNA uptake [Vibrio cincinnatiensis]|uniref:Predicted Rossmann fold nucleotide-binding protein DprA/Smf involved in DNA uptake n=1 Tax=Vibrio cincinnatiensis DSM 19608 TaxID=1123491 RepID=A0A1T4SBK2_VIBCI|nr:DNA-processing protein DprA [Vibrio cincinnatiensis]SKA25624.1 Predicted Rossmann fold nucleotide-binding protein DprA/Smf involved in DNA uptake [Vibrio cincinnatiensis DSM 19608]SUP49070.1 Rossmann fold nucleotide-binding protein Smf possibly involved in DNA uptake [Vibrio cincinnatiensis]
MNLTTTAQAIILLTSYFGKHDKDAAKPLTNAEWARFAMWLRDGKLSPADLLDNNKKALLSQWRDPKNKVTQERIEALLKRGHSMALALEKWSRSGLWVITRADKENYPKRLLHQLGNQAPPVLYGCGDKALLKAGGIAVVGSRNASLADLAYAEQVGSKAASAGLGTVSGGARGVDESSMLGAMNAGGTVVGILADSLLKASTSAKYRSGLMNGNVVLVSPFNPEAGFNRFNAMDRNKYIYCLADTSLVVHSGAKGGTWEGAIQNLKKGWVPTWVKQTQDSTAGNAGIVAAGASWCSENIAELDVQSLLVSSTISNVNNQTDLFSQPQVDLFTQPNEIPQRESNDDLAVEDGFEKKTKNNDVLSQTKESVSPTKAEQEIVSKDSFYQLFVQYLQTVAIEPISESELVEVSDLHKGQVKIWLSLALEQNLVTKLTRPIRYQWIDDNSN